MNNFEPTYRTCTGEIECVMVNGRLFVRDCLTSRRTYNFVVGPWEDHGVPDVAVLNKRWKRKQNRKSFADGCMYACAADIPSAWRLP